MLSIIKDSITIRIEKANLSIWSVGGTHNLSNCMGGLDMEWSLSPHIQEVLWLWKKFWKKNLVHV